MGRDVQQWGKNALIYVVAPNPIEQSCAHPTMMFYDYAVDAEDARLISDYLPFDDSRTIVCYFLPETTNQIDLVRQLYPNAELTPYHDNLGRGIFTRLVVPPPASPPLKDTHGDRGANVMIMPLYCAAPADSLAAPASHPLTQRRAAERRRPDVLCYPLPRSTSSSSRSRLTLPPRGCCPDRHSDTNGYGESHRERHGNDAADSQPDFKPARGDCQRDTNTVPHAAGGGVQRRLRRQP